MTWMKWLGWIVLLIVLAWAALAAVGSFRWGEATRALEAQLEAARTAPAVKRYDARELEGLPSPVQRYFRTVLKEGQPIVAAARVDHEGSFNMGESTDNWKPFSSRQRVVTRRPGFVWDARVLMLPGLPVHVHDAYVAGTGILHPALLGLFTLIDLRGSGDVAQGELMRFFAEAAWYPTALLPSQGVRWEAVDETTARATLVDGPLSLTLRFRFDAQGLIESARAEARGRTVGKTIVMTPWEGRWSNYQERDGMRVPMTGEVAWLAPEGRKPYWRGTIRSLQYEFML
jgi:hypothetical protein